MSQSFIASGVKTGRREMGRVYAELVQIRLERGSSEASAMLLVFFFVVVVVFFLSASLFCAVDLNSLDLRYV